MQNKTAEEGFKNFFQANQVGGGDQEVPRPAKEGYKRKRANSTAVYL